MTPARRAALAAALGLAVAGCFEEPVTEELELRFPDAATVEVGAKVTLTVPQGDTGAEALTARLDALERDLLAGASPWAHRFVALEPRREGQGWQREGGRLQWFRQWASADPARLADFFADTPVHVAYSRRDGTSELAFFPGAGTRATAAEARRMEAALGPWMDAVTEYLDAGSQLWGHLDRHPRRRRGCLAHLFEVEKEEGHRLALTPAEERLLERVSDSMGAVAQALQVPAGEAETFEELGRRVYDPYPAAVRVVVAGRVLAVEGLRKGTDGGWEVPGRSPWNAVSGLAGRWFSPDPLLAQVEHVRRDADKRFDLDAFLAQPFTTAEAPPSAPDVRRAILAALAPPPASRIEWTPP
jgi:hypothetical protein